MICRTVNSDVVFHKLICLRYLLIDYHLATLLEKSSTDRRTTLQKSRAAFESFLSLLSHYEILSENDQKLYHNYTDDPKKFSTISTTDFGARRAAKIANFQAEKELKKKLEYLSKNPAYLEKDEDAVREVQLANIGLRTHYTFQALENINREEEVLALAPPTAPTPETLARDYRERMGIRDDSYSDRLDTAAITSRNGPILSKDGKPLRPFTLLDSRQRLQNGVFRPGHNLPTMTIDEYLEEEKARGGIIEGGGAASGIAPEPDEDNYEKADAEIMKAREWDDYKESHAKGSGNTLNRG